MRQGFKLVCVLDNVHGIESDVVEAVKLGANAVEFRLDLMLDAIDLAKEKMFWLSKNYPKIFSIATLREVQDLGKFNRDDTISKANILEEVIAKQLAKAIDIEIENLRNYARVVEKLETSNLSLIASHHSFGKKNPSRSELFSLCDEANKFNPEIIKLAIEPNSNSELDELLQFLQDWQIKTQLPKLALIPVGKIGSKGRLSAPFLGSCLAFASLNKGEVKPAPGMLTVAEMTNYLKKNGGLGKADDAVPSFSVTGVAVSRINLNSACEHIFKAVRSGDSGKFVCATDSHVLYHARRNAEIRKIMQSAFLVTPDGMPLVWTAWLKGFLDVGRVYGPDLMLRLCDIGRKYKIRHFFYGGKDEVLQKLLGNLRAKFSGIEIIGAESPPFRGLTSEEQEDFIAKMNELKPDLLWLGLGAPKQEKFAYNICSKTSAKVSLCVGAAFDFHAGNVKQAPEKMQRLGLEWLFRLWQEPRRLWQRYFIGNSSFLLATVFDFLKRLSR